MRAVVAGWRAVDRVEARSDRARDIGHEQRDVGVYFHPCAIGDGARVQGGDGAQRSVRSGVPGKRTLSERLVRRASAGKRAGIEHDDIATAAVEAKGAGQPLDPGVRRAAEGELGADLADVRVHTDGDSRDASWARVATSAGSDEPKNRRVQVWVHK